MESTLSYGGWLGRPRVATGASAGLNIASFTAALMVGMGTGATFDDLSRLQQHQANATGTYQSHPVAVASAPVRTAVEAVERIREIFSPAISDLANTFGVSRQTVYNWLKGEQPKSDHFIKLTDLAQAADVIASAGISVTSAILKRKIFGGKNLFEIVSNNGSSREAALILVRILRQEADQQQRLANRFKGRKPVRPSDDSDFPAENNVG
jgi:DNA-binding transcriptional regulator YiaG